MKMSIEIGGWLHSFIVNVDSAFDTVSRMTSPLCRVSGDQQVASRDTEELVLVTIGAMSMVTIVATLQRAAYLGQLIS